LFCYGLLARYAPGAGGAPAGLLAGAVYAATPLGYRALSYGILPTILAQWLSLAFFTALLGWLAGGIRGHGSGVRDQGSRVTAYAFRVAHSAFRIPFYVLLLAAALIAFPTIAVFDTFVVGLLALGLLARRDRRGWGVAAIGAAAWVVALALYYGVYLNDL